MRYLCVIAARHRLNDPHDIVKASMCGLFSSPEPLGSQGELIGWP